MISLLREKLELQDQAFAELQEEIALLNQRLQAMEDSAETDGYGSQVPSSSERFPRPTKKSLLKKQRRQRG